MVENYTLEQEDYDRERTLENLEYDIQVEPWELEELISNDF